MSVEQIERRLQALAVDLEWPATVDVTDTVTSRLTTPPAPVPMSWGARLRPALAVAGLLLAVFAAVLVVSPGTRSAVASWFGLGGVQVERGVDRGEADEADGPTRLTIRDLEGFMGEPVTLAQAGQEVAFPLRTLDLQGDLNRVGGGVYYDDTVEGGMVHIVYEAQQGLPPVRNSKAVGAILTQFPGQDSPTFTKELVQGNNVEFLELDGDIAMWVTGKSHVLIRNADGEPLRHTARLSANALVWVGEGGVTYRLESALSLDKAVELAVTLE